MAVIRTHDALFRFVFGEPEQMGDLLRSNLPAAVVAAIDWRTLRRRDGTFVDAELQERHADLLFETCIGERPLLLYVLVEHKSGDAPLTAYQLLRYVVRVHDAWLKANPDARTLPPVLPLVVHHGAAPWAVPRSVRALVELDGLPADVAAFLRGLQPDLTFVLDDLATVDEAALDARCLSAATSLCLRFLQWLRSCPENEALDAIVRWQSLITQMLRHPRKREVMAALFSWYLIGSTSAEPLLRTVMSRIHDDETRQAMKNGLDELLEKGFAKGLVKGREEGREEGREAGREEGREVGHLSGQREMLRRLLGKRFGAIPPAVDARIEAATATELAMWGERFLTAASPTDVVGS